MEKRYRIPVLGAALIIVSLLLASCGGSSGPRLPQTVSGTAAAGAPILGLASLKDSAGAVKGPVTIGTDGGFSFDVTGMKAPFALLAAGTSGGKAFELYSAATGAGTANINPLTSLLAAGAAGVNDPSAVWANPGQYGVTPARVAEVEAEIRLFMKPLLDAYGVSGSFLTGSYSADHSGFDAVLDVLAVILDASTGIVTLVDKTTGTTIATASVTGLSTPILAMNAGSVPSVQAVTDLKAIAQQLAAQAAVIKGKGTGVQPADVDGFFASDFGVDSGLGRADTIDFIVSYLFAEYTLADYANVSLLGKAGSDYIVKFDIILSNGTVWWYGISPSEGTVFTKEDGQWKIKGNGFYSWIYMFASSWKIVGADGAVSRRSGIAFWNVADLGSAGFQTARVTGPGLPAGGLTFTNDGSGYLYLDSPFRTPTFPWCNNVIYLLTDDAISRIPDNADYAFTFFASDGTTVLETRTMTLPRRPLTAAELTDDVFPTLGVTSHALAAAGIGGTLTVPYTLPSAAKSINLYAELDYYSPQGSAGNFSASGPGPDNDGGFAFPLVTESSVGIEVPEASRFTPASAVLDFDATDALWRTQSVVWFYQ